MEWQQAGPEGLNQAEGWRLRLEASGVPELEPIAGGLARLEDRLGGDDVDPFTVGSVMVYLGGRVRDLASTEVGRAVSDRLEALAGLLGHEGRRIAEAPAGALRFPEEFSGGCV